MLHGDDGAPEVVQRESDLIPANDAAELPQVIQHQELSKFPPKHSSNYTSLNDWPPEEKVSLHSESPVGVNADPANATTRRRRMRIAVAAGILVVIAIALGVGLGVGLSQRGKSSSNSPAANDSSSTTASSASGATRTASATTSAVTSGSTGLASFSCNSTEPTDSTDGTTYIQECYTMFSVGGQDMYDHNVTMQNLGGKITVYSFQSCLDKCDEWNQAGEEPPCRAVSYYANMTKPIADWGGNCFIKNSRGGQANPSGYDWSHSASAYQACLNETCFAEN